MVLRFLCTWFLLQLTWNVEGGGGDTFILGERTKNDGVCNLESIKYALFDQDLSKARYLAQLYLSNGSCSSSMREISQFYVPLADSVLLDLKEAASQQQLLSPPITLSDKPVAKHDDPYSCWSWSPNNNRNGSNGTPPPSADLWDQCCSMHPQRRRRRQDRNDNLFSAAGDEDDCTKRIHGQLRPMCCEFSQHTNKSTGMMTLVATSNHIYLPVLNELMLRMRVQFTTKLMETGDEYEDDEHVIEIEQDGFLRPFKTAAVLWPSGYLLAQCLADLDHCGIAQDTTDLLNETTVTLELGAGVGAASIVLAKRLQMEQHQRYNRKSSQHSTFPVIATDQELGALALTKANSLAANVNVTSLQLDHYNMSQVQEVANTFMLHQKSQRLLVLGSSLEGLFDGTTDNPHHTLWTILRTLNPSVAIFSHSIGSLPPPIYEDDDMASTIGDDAFVLVQTIPGVRLGVYARSSNTQSSDFEISVFVRRRATDDNYGSAPRSEL